MTYAPTQIAPATDREIADMAAGASSHGPGNDYPAICVDKLIARIRSVREQTIRECAAIALDNLDQDIYELILALLTNKGEQR